MTTVRSVLLLRNNTMKHNTHIYSRLGDYAPEYSSEPNWKIAIKHVAFITLLVVGLVSAGKILLTYVMFMAQQY